MNAIDQSLEDGLTACHKLEDSLNTLLYDTAEEIRNAIHDFDHAPISISSIDRLRIRLRGLADELASPMNTPAATDQGDALLAAVTELRPRR